MMSLRNLSKLAVIKYGVDDAKNELEVPQALISELETLEELVKSQLQLTGHFTVDDDITSSARLDVSWSNGEWKFTPLGQQTISIRAGRRQDLGLAGGELFLFRNRQFLLITSILIWRELLLWKMLLFKNY